MYELTLAYTTYLSVGHKSLVPNEDAPRKTQWPFSSHTKGPPESPLQELLPAPPRHIMVLSWALLTTFLHCACLISGTLNKSNHNIIYPIIEKYMCKDYWGVLASQNNYQVVKSTTKPHLIELI